MQQEKTFCYHCGDECITPLTDAGKSFCCRGCREVYLLLNENNLCNYYSFDKNPGIKVKGKFSGARFAYLDDESVIRKLVSFRSDGHSTVTFSLPQIHCSSCIFLLENLHRINKGVISSRTNFQRKEVFVSFDESKTSLRKLVELLTFIGYEPFISLEASGDKKNVRLDRKQLYRLGVAGFCFSNIMMFSFPEYFSHGLIDEQGLRLTFSGLIFVLSLPVLIYSAGNIFTSAFKGLRQKNINIDVPLALAIVITFARSYYEILSRTGAGYLDSGTGIVFFILVGRWFQNKTYDALTFDRDYHAYFPLGVTILKNGIEQNIPATKLRKGDSIIIKNEEMVPADALLREGSAIIDYSFVSGEDRPVAVNTGQIIYAGGKQRGTSIQLEVIKEPSQSHITELWNNDVFGNAKNEAASFIHPWSRYFTSALFAVALFAAAFWYFLQPSMVWPVVTAVLIVACPCSLLLSATFTYGNVLRIFGRNRLYLKNANVIETLAGIDTIVFDKTGTLTESNAADISFSGNTLSGQDKRMLKAITAQSSHTLSQLIHSTVNVDEWGPGMVTIDDFREQPGEGIAATIATIPIKVGAAPFVGEVREQAAADHGSRVYVMIGNTTRGFFEIRNKYRSGITVLVNELLAANFQLHVLSGDNDGEKKRLEKIFTPLSRVQFNTTPQQKLEYVKHLQQAGRKVLMIGDGLNDAGALMQSDVAISVSNDAARFTPACDAILDGQAMNKISRLLGFASAGKKIVKAGFVLSILYNLVGLYFALRGLLDPVVAAVLMPASSISIVVMATGLSSLVARIKKL